MQELWHSLVGLPSELWCLIVAFFSSAYKATEPGSTLTSLQRLRTLFYGTFFGVLTVWIVVWFIPFSKPIQIPLNGYFGVMGFNLGSGASNYSEAYKTNFPKFLADLLLLRKSITNEKIDLPNSGDRPA